MTLRLLLLVVLTPLLGLSQKPLQPLIVKLVSDPQLAQTKWSICAVDLTTGDTLAAFQPQTPRVGASITKLISSSAALYVLGPEHRATTEVILEGKMLGNGVFDGNIRILGHGDVSLGSKYFCNQGEELEFIDRWVAAVKAKGIKSITGDIIADGSTFGTYDCPIGWLKEDMGNYYGTGAYGLNFYDNVLKLKFNTTSAGSPLKYTGCYPADKRYNLKIEANAAGISYDNTHVYGTPFNFERTIKGRLPANRTGFEVKASMPDPERLLADLVYAAMQDNGIRVDGGAMSARFNKSLQTPAYESEIIFTEQGRTLEEIIYWTNHQSLNMFAEGNLLQLGAQRYGTGTYENSLRVLDEVLQQWQIGPCRVVDGSGLSRENRMSAGQFVQLLSVQTKESYYSSFYNSLPVAGLSGTLKKVCRGQAAQGKMHAKSGSMRGIRAYSGYVETPEGHQIAFSIIANGFGISSDAMISKMEPFFNGMATFQAQPK